MDKQSAVKILNGTVVTLKKEENSHTCHKMGEP